jgi:hypothetical protein
MPLWVPKTGVIPNVADVLAGAIVLWTFEVKPGRTVTICRSLASRQLNFIGLTAVATRHFVDSPVRCAEHGVLNLRWHQRGTPY